MNANESKVNVSADPDLDLDAFLDSMSNEDLAALDEPIDEGDIDLDLAEFIEAEAAHAVRKAQLYEEQESEVTTPLEIDAETPDFMIKRRRVPARRRAAAGDDNVERLRNTFSEEELERRLTFNTSGEVDVNAKLAEMARLPKKVQEKAVNVVMNRDDLSKISVFTRLCLRQVASHEDLLSRGSEVARMKSTYLSCAENKGAGYSEGTARSQAGQMRKLVPFLHVLDGDSSIMQDWIAQSWEGASDA